VKTLAAQAGINVRQPRSLRRSILEPADLAVLAGLDVLVVAAYGLLLPSHVLLSPRLGCVNVHASLLPRWRGAAPVERCIMAGDTGTGVSIMHMDEGLDTGPVFRQREFPISASITGQALEGELAVLGAALLYECLGELETLEPVAQTGPATYAAKLTAADAEVDWTRSAVDLANQIRALSGRQSATVGAGDLRIRILRASPATDAGVAPAADKEPAADKAPAADKEPAADKAPTADKEPAADVAPGTIVQADKHGLVIACGTGSLALEELQLNRGKGRPLTGSAAVNGFPQFFSRGLRL
jgi:methionyl-tRNA formyltransferase